MSLTEKDLAAEDSLDSDSGHDSADSLTAMPVDDRERIVHLETAVAWIKEEMDNLRRYDKEILQDLWKVRTGIHEIREIHRNQLDAEQKYLEVNSVNSSSLQSHRRLSRTSGQPSESPTSPLSPLSPPPSIARLSASAFNLKEPPVGPAKGSDDLVLQSFFGSDNMNKVNAVLWQSSDSLALQTERKSQSSDRLLLAEMPPLPEKKQPRGNPISRSPKTSQVHASTPDMSSLKRKNEPMSDIGMEMRKLRIRLRETANQTVAEIEERFSPKFSRLTLGPVIDLPPAHASSNAAHSHQGSLDSFPSPVPSVGRIGTSPSGHGRQHSLPLSVVGQTRPRSPTKSSAQSPPSPVSRPSQPSPTSPPSRSPTPPHQQSHPHTRQASLGSSNLSGLITTCYQNQPVGYNQQRSTQPQPYEVANGIAVGSHSKPPPPSMSRQYSPRTQSSANIAGGVGYPPSEQTGYVYASGSRVYASNPNLLSGGGPESSTHYSTAVIKKRRTSGPKNGTESQNYPPSTGGRAHEYDRLQPMGSQQHPLQPQPQGSNHSHRIGRTHSPHTQYSQTGNDKVPHPPNSYYNQRSVPASSSESNFKQAPEQIKPYISSGELRASMRQFQYVPFAEQKKSLALGRGRGEQHDPENTWL